MSEPICSIPSYDDDDDSYRRLTYCMSWDSPFACECNGPDPDCPICGGTGKAPEYTECDMDGDHEGVDYSDIPSYEEQDKLWREYFEWVVRTGNDVLGELIVSYHNEQTWVAKFRRSITGYTCLGARPMHGAYTTDITQVVMDYYELVRVPGTGTLRVRKDSLDIYRELLGDETEGRITTRKLRIPRTEEVCVRAVRAAARRQLRTKDQILFEDGDLDGVSDKFLAEAREQIKKFT